MYLNDRKSKNIGSSSESCKGSCYKEQQNLLRTQVTNKLNNIHLELKDDINKSVARLLKATKQTSSIGHHQNNKTLNVKLQKETTPRKKLIAQSDSTKLIANRQGGRFKSQQSLDVIQTDWLTLRSTLKRSFSYSQTKPDKSVTKDSRSVRIELLKNSRLMDSKRHLKKDISCHINRCGSWLSNLHRQSSLTTALFIIFNVCVFATNKLAPVSVQAAPIVAAPIWLGDELIDIDQDPISSSDIDPSSWYNELAFGRRLGYDDDNEQPIEYMPPAIVLSGDQIGAQDKLSRQPTSTIIASARDKNSFRQLLPHNVADLHSGKLQLSRRLQRRRLERERALEPLPWMREQPMRRGFNPALPEEIEEQAALGRGELEQQTPGLAEDSSPLEFGRDERRKWTSPADASVLQSRQSRQLNNQIYEELLKHLLEGAVDGRSLLNDLYDELELRARSNNQRPMASSSIQPMNSNQQQKLAALSQGQEDLIGGQDSSQENGADATLVVAGDEVSSGSDDPIPSLPVAAGSSNSRASLSAAYAQDMLAGYGNVVISPDNSKSILASNGQSMSPARLLSLEKASNEDTVPTRADLNSSSDSSFYILPIIDSIARHQANADSLITSVDSDNSDGVEQQQHDFSLPESQRAGPLMGASFHVIEDIDQTDNNVQDVTSPIPSADNQDDQQQFNKQTDLLTGDGAPQFQKRSLGAQVKVPFESARKEVYNNAPDGSEQRNSLVLLRALLSMLASKRQNQERIRANGDSGRLYNDAADNSADLYKFYNPPPVNGAPGAIWTGRGDYAMPASYYSSGDDNSELAYQYPEGGQAVPLAALAAYLSAMYQPAVSSRLTQNKLSGVLHPASGWPVALLPELATLPLSQQQHIGAAGNSKTKDHLTSDSHIMQVVILVATLLVALLVVKLILQFADRQSLRRRFETSMSSSLGWPSSSAKSACKMANTGVVVGTDVGEKQPVPLKEANINRRLSGAFADESAKKPLLSDDSSSFQEIRNRHFDLLSQKLVKLLSLTSKSPANGDLQSPSGSPTKTKKASEGEIDELANQTVDVIVDAAYESEENDLPGRFRSSRSYIKSLINALTTAHSQRTETLPSAKSSESCNSTAEPGEVLAALDDGCLGGQLQESLQSDLQQEPGIVMSQMNISAAHLILAYMEKHLEDKEQLEREWLELNASGGATNLLGKAQSCRSPIATTGGSKIDQLVLQRLAKVALSEENRQKNRNCAAVPYDRNRVKLNCSPLGASGTTGTNNNNNNHNNNTNAANSRLASSLGDYINASYIHDDDLRRPTHIIAQGPTEQTSGQFWQMVWEQGVSVIVMLTRLNENSTKMCHCYWPTNTNASQVTCPRSESGSPPSQASGSGNGGPNGASERRTSSGQPASATTNTANNNANDNANNGAPSNGRRSSVTSVFSLVGSRNNGNIQPIIADGDLSDNVLYFEISHNHKSLDGSPIEEESECDNDNDNDNHNDSQKAANETISARVKSISSTTKFEIHLVSEHVSSNDYLVRNMCIINRSTGETRTITQFHYLSWPEMGVPVNVKSLLQFRRKVHKSYRDLKSPILVHCSDGTGRSGTYTLIDIILDRIKNGAKEIDPRATLEHLRDQRAGLCATQAQFEFVLMALAEEIQIILNALPQ